MNKCGGNMRVVAFITDYQTSKRILKHIGGETVRPPPLKSKYPNNQYPGYRLLGFHPLNE